MDQPARNINSLRRQAIPAANDENLSETSSLRREVLLANQTKAQQMQAEAANDEVTESERQTEASETQVKQNIDQIVNQKTQIDQGAIGNLSLSEISSNTGEMNIKLAALSERLKEKYEAANDATVDLPVKAEEPTTSESLSSRISPEDTNNNVIPSVVADDPKPSKDLLESTNEVKGAPSLGPAAMIVSGLQTLTGAVKTGFAKSKSVSDKIAGMLFKYTVTQAVNAAKIALAVFGIILALDLLKMAWNAWGEKIMAKFEEWTQTFSKWWDNFKEWSTYFSDMKYAFEGMQGDLMGIRNAWESGDWPALASAIGTAFVDGIKTLSGIMDRVITKLIATILNKLGFKDTAKSIEAEGLQRYQNMTNNKLDPENQQKLAEEQLKREKKDGLTSTQRGVTSFLPDSWREKLGFITKNEHSQIEAEKKDQKARQSLSKDDQVKVVAASNEAREAVARLENIAVNADPNNKGQMATLDKYRKEAQNYINNPALSKSPNVKAELQNQLDRLTPKQSVKNTVTPETSTASKDVQTAKNIQIAEAQKAKTNAVQNNNTANVQNNIVKSSRQYNVQAPITGTAAPGIFKATGVN
ncbi:baseplate hub subunit and tail length [Acinetobacter phage ZZ1]|jgi:hypothetical protein|uniref:Baseplate hub subunit, tail length determinator n=3 Tax=Caudoviricetes TaxID=2731619 RepID=A0A410T549_9CAUD|nr:baseplate hub subunit and tail length [Acinetobacter phage ZZ1]AFL47731.1 baseplate hub subunit, tail length determinator [Acinetobacter phage ZZ1]QAU03870.1 baseplate hub subunit, tail length determinator [Acinetobacter phage Henu6]